MQASNPLSTFGPDINQYTKSVDFERLKKNSDFIYLRASGSGSGNFIVDEHFLDYAKSCRSYNILSGAYHYAKPSTDISTAASQCDDFIETLYKGYGEGDCGDLYPALDVEEPLDKSLTTTQLINWIEAFSNRFFKKTKRKLMLYTGYFFIQMYDNFNVPGRGYPLKNMPLWIALYPDIPGNPKIPPNIGGWTSWMLWQFTQNGTLQGIGNPVDLNWGPIDIIDLKPPGNVNCFNARLKQNQIYTSWCSVPGNNIWGYNLFVNSNYAGTVPEKARNYVINKSNFYLPPGKPIVVTIEAFDKFGGVSLKRSAVTIDN
ncbi:glycoside hydrolase family 25 protein [Clostridium massiliamazoniense]|uniref:glycoside hydrolase family 25 protein n=1 Tax=Clostridium massiliamazoniense TaxID=1347366 RepID=UPI0006D7E82C|nr:glycoside hydrolase family 25 protein [Clostridium massiliamazoniense]